jgi:ligand-binding sensor domain-containing protein
MSKIPFWPNMKTVFTLFLKIIFPIFLYTPNYSQILSSSFKNINSENGLPSSECFGIMQDSKGYIWISTSKGVTRYDGKKMKLFTSENGLPENTVFNSYEDKKNRIWFRSYSTICYYFNDSVYGIEANSQLKSQFQKRLLSNILIDEGDTIWLTYHGLKDFIKISPPNYNKIRIEQKRDSSLNIKKFKNGQYLYSYSHGYPASNLCIDHKANTETKKLRQKISLNLFSNIIFINDSDFVLYGGGDKLYYYHGDFVRQLHFPNRVTAVNKINNSLWVSVYKKGLYHFNLSKPDTFNLHILDGYTASIIKDYEDGIWISTIENGIYYKRNLEDKVYLYSGYENTNVVRFLKKINNQLILGTDKPSLIIIDSTFQNRSVNLSNKAVGYNVNDIIYYKNQYYLSGFGALTKYDSRFFQKEEINYVTDTFYKVEKNATFRQIEFIRDNEFIMSDGNVISFIKDLITYKHFNLPSRIISFNYDSLSKTVYIATKTGLFVIENSSELKPVKFPGLDSEPIKQITHLKNGTFLICAQEGIFLKDKNYSKVFTKKNTLFSSMGIDDKGNIWAATNKGIIFLKKTHEKYIPYPITRSDGIQSDEVNQVIYFNNLIWYTTNNGVYRFKPSDILSKSVEPKVEIESFFVNSKEHTFNNYFTLPYNLNNIEVKATCLSYLPGSLPLISFRLIGYDTSWKFLEIENSINYTNLPEGNYILEIKGLNNKNIASRITKKIKFEIKPPFWKAWWFILTEIIAAALALYGLVLTYVKNIQAKEKEKNKINQLLAEYQMTALRAQINPHFIFNCISSIQVLILKKKIDKAYDYLQKFSKLLRLVLENSKRNLTSLREEIEVVSLYVELEQMRFESSFKFIRSIHPLIDTSKIIVPYMLLQPLVENAIWHGLMHSDKNEKSISLIITSENNKLIIEILDNGIGRKKSNEYKTGIKTSLGENITTERLNLFTIEKQEKASIQITDLFENDKPTGTLVKLIIPQ